MWIFNRKNSKLKALALGIGAALFSGGVASADIMIDSFSAPPGALIVLPGASATTSVTQVVPSVFGGNRTVTIDRVAGPSTIFVEVNPSLALDGYATVNTPSQTTANFQFHYHDGPSFSFDMSAEKYFVMKLIKAEYPGVLEASVKSGGVWESKSVAFSAGSSNVVVPFTLYSSTNFADVNGLKFTIYGSEDFDASIDSISTMVPVPSAVWAGLGLIGVVGIRRMRRFQNA